MTTEAIAEALEREPFEPFRVWTSSGEHYDVPNPHLVAMMKNRMYVALPASDRGAMLSYLHITAIETIDTRPKKKTPRRRPRR